METEAVAETEEALPVGAHHVRHRLAAHSVAVQPQPPVQREADSVAAVFELPDVRVYWQTMRPSTVAGPRGGPAPAKR